MRRLIPPAPSPAMLVAVLALVVALSGTAYAATKISPGSVNTRQLADDAVRTDKVQNGSLLRRDFKNGQVPRGPRGAKGKAGATNVTVREATNDRIDGQKTGVAVSACKGAERAVGGGAGFTDPMTGDAIVESRPSTGKKSAGGTPTAWRVSITNGQQRARTPVAYVVCAAP